MQLKDWLTAAVIAAAMATGHHLDADTSEELVAERAAQIGQFVDSGR